MKAVPFFVDEYQNAALVTPHATDPNVFDGLFYESDNPSTSATVLPAGCANSVTIWALDGDVIPLRVSKVLSVQGGTNGRVFGLHAPREPRLTFTKAALVTPSDTEQNLFDAVYVNALGGGNVLSVQTLRGNTITFTAQNLHFFPVRVQKVLAATDVTVIGFSR